MSNSLNVVSTLCVRLADRGLLQEHLNVMNTAQSDFDTLRRSVVHGIAAKAQHSQDLMFFSREGAWEPCVRINQTLGNIIEEVLKVTTKLIAVRCCDPAVL
ncbi:unnamed protein product [Arctogadus glacialis]